MLNSKFDINSPEWIDRVFENRNKSYGAYDLRKHYAGNLFKAFAITILSIAAIGAGVSYLMGKQAGPVALNKGVIDVNNKPVNVVDDNALKKTDPKQTAVPNKKEDQSQTSSPDNAPANIPYDANDVDVKPFPVGGAQTWTRFLETTLRYPALARELKLTGHVLMSFIVERDGRISDIKVENHAGHGFDEEALRVLKLSPTWVPGKENGHTVRVKYQLPIDFRIQRI